MHIRDDDEAGTEAETIGSDGGAETILIMDDAGAMDAGNGDVRCRFVSTVAPSDDCGIASSLCFVSAAIASIPTVHSSTRLRVGVILTLHLSSLTATALALVSLATLSLVITYSSL